MLRRFASARRAGSTPVPLPVLSVPGDDDQVNESQRISATEKAMAVMPGIAAAKFRGDKEGALLLLQSYKIEVIRGMGLNDAEAWSCMTAATLVWFEDAVQTAADATGGTPETVLREMGLRTAKAGT